MKSVHNVPKHRIIHNHVYYEFACLCVNYTVFIRRLSHVRSSSSSFVHKCPHDKWLATKPRRRKGVYPGTTRRDQLHQVHWGKAPPSLNFPRGGYWEQVWRLGSDPTEDSWLEWLDHVRYVDPASWPPEGQSTSGVEHDPCHWEELVWPGSCCTEEQTGPSE